MKRTSKVGFDAAILDRVVQPNRADLTIASARAFLKFQFNADDRQRMHQLALKNQSGKLTVTEKTELDSFVRVGRFIDLLVVKARLSLKKPSRGD